MGDESTYVDAHKWVAGIIQQKLVIKADAVCGAAGFPDMQQQLITMLMHVREAFERKQGCSLDLVKTTCTREY